MSKKHSKMSLPVQMVIGLVLGVIVGSMTSAEFTAAYLRPFGQLFITLIRMVVVPLVLATIIAGAAGIHDLSKLGRVATKTLVYYFLTTGVAVAIGLFLANIMQPGIGLDLSTKGLEAKQITPPSLIQTLLNIVPMNPIDALAKGNMLQVIFFAVIFGFALSSLGETGKPLLRIFELIGDVMIRMTNMVMMAAPIGVYCLIARTFSNIGFSGFIPMAKYMLCVLGALAIHCLGSYSALMAIFTRLNPYKFIRKYFPVMSFAFSTATSNATIPMAIETLDEKIGVSKKISSFTIPLGATINMDGTAIMQGVAVCFAAQAFGIALTPTDYLTVIATATLASIGTAGVPSVGLITLSMVFASVGLPVEAIAMIMGIDRILDMARTMVNITGDAMCTVIVANQDGALNRDVFNSK